MVVARVFKIFSLIKRFWFVPVISAVTIWGCIQRMEARHWQKQARTCEKSRAADHAAWDAASRVYSERVSQREAEQKKEKERADEKLDDALARGRAAAAQYISVQRQADYRRTGSLAGKATTAQVADEPGQVAELDDVRIPARDIEICTENTIRLLNAKEWSQQRQ